MRNAVLMLFGLATTVFAHEGHSSNGESEHTTATPVSNYLTASPSGSIIYLSFQSGVYTIPDLNPSDKLTYGAPNPPVPTHTSKTEHETKNSTLHSSSPTSRTSVSISSAPGSSSPSGSPASTTNAPSASFSPTTSAAPQQSPGAARALYPEIIGVAIGGLMAGLALA